MVMLVRLILGMMIKLANASLSPSSVRLGKQIYLQVRRLQLSRLAAAIKF